MDEFTPVDPPAIVRPAITNIERAMELILEAKALDDSMRQGIRVTADQMVERGRVLIKAKQLCGKGGPWQELLQKVRWSERTCYRYMRLATDAARSAMIDEFEGHTHKQLDDKPGDEDSDENDDEPLTLDERKVLYSLIGTVKPALAKKLREGTKKLSDADLLAEVPVCCSKCQRLGAPPKPCEQCAIARKTEQGKLFEDGQEPDDEDDSGSKPKPPPDPYKQARAFVSKTATSITKLVAEDTMLYEALKACRLMDHAGGKLRCCAFAGVAKVIDLVAEGETDLAAIKKAYDVASGGFVPPMYERKGR
jgi:hypothetical protein